eukprot:SAG25_NODE_17_length_24192_cov_70.399452_26_plen_143_part_00
MRRQRREAARELRLAERARREAEREAREAAGDFDEDDEEDDEEEEEDEDEDEDDDEEEEEDELGEEEEEGWDYYTTEDGKRVELYERYFDSLRGVFGARASIRDYLKLMDREILERSEVVRRLSSPAAASRPARSVAFADVI